MNKLIPFYIVLSDNRIVKINGIDDNGNFRYGVGNFALDAIAFKGEFFNTHEEAKNYLNCIT